MIYKIKDFILGEENILIQLNYEEYFYSRFWKMWRNFFK